MAPRSRVDRAEIAPRSRRGREISATSRRDLGHISGISRARFGQVAPPSTCDGMEGALHYYNQQPPAAFASASAADASVGFGRAVRGPVSKSYCQESY